MRTKLLLIAITCLLMLGCDKLNSFSSSKSSSMSSNNSGWNNDYTKSPTMRKHSGDYYKIRLKMISEPNGIQKTQNSRVSSDDNTITHVRKVINDYYYTNFTDEQIAQIYNISEKESVNITTVIDNSKIDDKGDVIYSR